MTPFTFFWRLSPSGYHWRPETEDPGEGQHGDAILVPRDRNAYSVYQPLALETTPLFLEFAAAGPTADGFRKFADKYGALWDLWWRDDDGRLIVTQELEKRTFLDWRTAHAQVWAAVNLWTDLRSGDQQTLRTRIRWEKDQKGRNVMLVYVEHQGDPLAPSPRSEHPEPAIQMMSHEDLNPWMLERFDEGEPKGPALSYVLMLINRHLDGAVSPLLYAGEDGGIETHLVPKSLIAAIWVQFSTAVANNGNMSYSQCEQCGSWFTIGPRRARKSRRFCADACRAAAYRARKEAGQ